MTVRQARIKKQGKEAQHLSDSQRVLSNGKRFISELERLSTKDTLDKERYEELLEIFKRFVALMDENISPLGQKNR